MAKKEGLKIVGGKKARIAQNIAMNKVSSRIGSMKRIVEDVANSEVIELALSRNLKPVEHEQAMNGAYKSFRRMFYGRGKADVKSYITLVQPKIQKLIEEQVLDAAKVQMHLWVVWKKKERIMKLNDEDMGGFNDEELSKHGRKLTNLMRPK